MAIDFHFSFTILSTIHNRYYYRPVIIISNEKIIINVWIVYLVRVVIE